MSGPPFITSPAWRSPAPALCASVPASPAHPSSSGILLSAIKRSQHGSLFVALLAVLALCCGAPTAVSAATSSVGQVVGRTDFTTTTQAANGKLTTSLSPQPINFESDSGAWKPIDTSLEPA